LEYKPSLVEVVDGKVLLANPEVESTTVAPHHANVVVGVELKQQSPILDAGQ
jgi:hypothetical protein